MRRALTTRLEHLGAGALAALTTSRGLWLTTVGAIAGLIRGGRAPGEIRRQLLAIGNRSLLFIAVTLGFLGMVLVYQTCLQSQRVTGDLSQVGVQLLRLAVSDFAPTLTGLMLATRVGAGIAAELGSMKVTEQLDALRMCGVRPIDYLLSPRLVASIVMTLALTVIGGAIMIGVGGLTAWVSFDLNPRTFFDVSRTGIPHVLLGLTKAATFGAAIPLVAGHFGLSARGSSEGVGAATTAAVIGSSLAVIALDFVLSVVGFLLLGDQL